ncbi:hypothetical protein SVIOM74S_03027 [Streptomyces violarus]
MPQSAVTAARPPSVTTRTRRAAGAGGAQQLTQAADLRQVAPAVDEDDVGAGGVDEGGALRGGHAHVVQQQAEGGEHLRRRLEGIGQEQQ